MTASSALLSRTATDYWLDGQDETLAKQAGLPLTIRDLSKSFKTNQVLRRINLHIPAGQFVAIVGKSGCGKSTFLRLLVGLDKPSGGEFWYGAAPAQQPNRNDVRVMFQEPRLLPWARVLSNVEVGLGRDRKLRNARDRALATLEEVGLGEKRNEWPSVLSGGQKQRVALARALVSRPRVLAFDEPLGALDALTRERAQELILGIWRETGKMVFFITHSVEEALFMGTKLVVMSPRPGRISHVFDLPFGRRYFEQRNARGIKASQDFIAMREKVLGLVFRDDEEDARG